MPNPDWTLEAPFAVTVTNIDGIILDMNEKAGQTFQKDGGRSLIGKNVLDCHPEPAHSKLAAMLKGAEPNVYTIEKKGLKKMIVQTSWYSAGRPAGLVELSIELPAEIPHFVRK